MAKNDRKLYEYDVFWQPFSVTYCITVAIIVAICLIQYNMSNPNYTTGLELLFYNIQCDNYLVLILAKVAESLVPTTITFSLTLLLAKHDNHFDKVKVTNIVVLTAILAIVGMLFPTMRQYAGFYIVLFLIYIIIAVLIVMLKKATISNIEITRNIKSEKSDGKFGR